MQGRLLDAVPLNTLTGVGAAQSSKLAKIGLHTVQDLLLHLPLRYEDRTHLYQIGELLPGVYATVEGEVLNSLAWSPSSGRLISVGVDGSKDVVPVLVTTQFNNLNIQKGQKFIFLLEVDDMGILRTKSLTKS